MACAVGSRDSYVRIAWRASSRQAPFGRSTRATWYDVIFFLDDKHRTVIEEIIISRVAGTAVGAEFYAHATAQQTLAVAMLPEAAQAHWGSENTVVGDETRGPNPSNGPMQGTKPS